MNYELLIERAKKLEEIAEGLADDLEVRRFLNGMRPFIDAAKRKKIVQPLEFRMPGGYFFLEGTLRKYPDLENAYSEFALEARGGDTPATASIRAMLREMDKPEEADK